MRFCLYIIYERIRSCRGRADVHGITELFVVNARVSMIIINSIFMRIKIFWSSCVDEDSIEVAIKSEHLNKQDVSVLEYEQEMTASKRETNAESN